MPTIPHRPHRAGHQRARRRDRRRRRRATAAPRPAGRGVRPTLPPAGRPHRRARPGPRHDPHRAGRLLLLASGQSDRPLTSEDAAQLLRSLGPHAVPALLPLLRTTDRAWLAASLLADIGHADPRVVEHLDQAISVHSGPNQEWAARALARLGRLDVVLARADRLPGTTLITAVAAPYTSFRDESDRQLRLDYRPLHAFIEQHPRPRPGPWPRNSNPDADTARSPTTKWTKHCVGSVRHT